MTREEYDIRRALTYLWQTRQRLSQLQNLSREQIRKQAQVIFPGEDRNQVIEAFVDLILKIQDAPHGGPRPRTSSPTSGGSEYSNKTPVSTTPRRAAL